MAIRSTPHANEALPIRKSPVPLDMRPVGLWAFESRHDASFTMQMTQHAFFKLLWIREGEGEIDFRGQRQPCSAGELILVPEQMSHRLIDSVQSPMTLYGLGIETQKVACLQAVCQAFQGGVYREPRLRTLGIDSRLRRILYLLYRDSQDGLSEDGHWPRGARAGKVVSAKSSEIGQLSSLAAAMDLLAELAELLQQQPTSTRFSHATQTAVTIVDEDPLLEAYIVWLHRHFYESVSLDAAASLAGMSRRTFTNRFKQRTGATWLEYVNTLRIRHAQELLKETDRKVTSIAFQCGYEDVTTFYRAYKRVVGQPLRRQSG